ncbi:hypothetical protein IWW34DRAFT_756063 [Fusarium oxysporum f. sp. albedinis]|nr:hypothetical protein IWW34DRAFT_756063 [Fusarium oxysporum f. sp. albedinis]KAJ0138922.1 Uncharacterized protein HZ326_18132 [Fusarium oxysporum f. sp. albedinis]
MWHRVRGGDVVLSLRPNGSFSVGLWSATNNNFTTDLVVCKIPEGKHAVAGSVFNATSQFGNAIGLAIIQVVTTLVTKTNQHVGTKPAEEALLQGYEASVWAMFSFTILCAFIAGVWLRKTGKVGLKQEDKRGRCSMGASQSLRRCGIWRHDDRNLLVNRNLVLAPSMEGACHKLNCLTV